MNAKDVDFSPLESPTHKNGSDDPEQEDEVEKSVYANRFIGSIVWYHASFPFKHQRVKYKEQNKQNHAYKQHVRQ